METRENYGDDPDNQTYQEHILQTMLQIMLVELQPSIVYCFSNIGKNVSENEHFLLHSYCYIMIGKL